MVRRRSVITSAALFLGATVSGIVVSPSVEAQRERESSSRRLPTDRIYPLAVDDTAGGVIAQWSHSAMRVPEAWAQGVDGSGVTVAVIDEGLVDNEGEFAGRIRATKDFVGGPGDTDHGTNAMGIIAASRADGQGIAGVAPGADLLVARALTDSGSIDPGRSLTNAVKWSVENGADVISMSLGVGSGDGTVAAIDWAVTQGVVVVMSAGNSACLDAYSYSNGQTIPNVTCRRASMIHRWANGLDGVITVAAIEQSGDRASYSSYGPEVDIAAPTDVMTTGVWRYETFNGTSAAAPNVAGVAALVLQARPSLTPAQVQAVIQASARAHTSIFEQPTWASCDQNYVSPTCSGLRTDALPQRWLGGAGAVDAAAAVTVARSAIFDVPVSISAGTLSFDAAWAATNAGATVKVDGRSVGSLMPGGVLTIDDFDAASQYAVSVVNDSMHRLALVQPSRSAIPAPVVQSTARRSSDTVKVVVESAAVGDLLWLYDTSGSLVSGCTQDSDTSTDFSCSNQYLQAGQQYVARVANARGHKSPISAPFTISGLDSLTLATPQITFGVELNRFVLRISRVVGASYYRFYGRGGWSMVSDTGLFVSGLSGIECVGSPTTVTCSWPATDGEENRASVYADVDQNAAVVNSKRSAIVRALAELASIPVASSVRAATISCSNQRVIGRCTGDNATNWTGTLEVETDMTTGVGQSLTGYRIESSVGDNGPSIVISGDGLTFGSDYDKIGVSVIGYYTRQDFRSYGAEYRTALRLPSVLAAPTVNCSRGASTVSCQGQAAGGRLEVRFVGSGGVVTHAGGYTSENFSLVPTGEIQVRARPTATHWARSEWVAAVVVEEPTDTTDPTATSDAVPTTSTPTTVDTANHASTPSLPEIVATTNRLAPTSLAPTSTVSPRVGSLQLSVSGSTVRLRLTCPRSVKGARMTVRDNGRVVARDTNGRTTWMLKSIRRGSHKFSVTAVVRGRTVCSSSVVPVVVR